MQTEATDKEKGGFFAQIGKIFSAIASFFTSTLPKDSKVEKPQVEEVVNEEVKREEARKRLDNTIENLFKEALELETKDEEALLKTVNNHIDIVSKEYSYLGHIDGQLRSRDFEIKTLTNVHATRITEHIYSKLKGKTDSLRFTIDEKNKEKDDVASELKSCTEFNNEMIAYSRYDHKSFSGFLGCMYFLFGFLLMLSDIPISLSLVGNFNIGTTVSADEFIDKLQDYEKLILAVGIAFSTIYVKILYDEYINVRAGSWTRKLKTLEKEEKPFFYAELIIKLIVKVGILIGLFFTLYKLGVFRNAFAGLIKREDVKAIEPDIYNVRFWSFIGMTIVIPAISGICLSIGMAILNNRSILKKAEKTKKDLTTLKNKLCDEIAILTKKLSEIDSFFQDWARKHEKVSIISEQFKSAYWQGFKRASQIEYGTDIYKTVEEYYLHNIEKKMLNDN